MEDHFGDMDFKVAGTEAGITALQMDIKIAGLNEQILKEALAQAKVGRTQIMANMLETIAEVRPEVGQYAPKIVQMKIDPDKIRDVIGAGGKIINQIIADCDNVKIDIEDDGRILIYHHNHASIQKAKATIESLIKTAKVGEVYEAKVVRIESFGAFVNLFPGTDGLLHVSKMAYTRVEKPSDVVQLGDSIKVVVTEIDDKGRVNVSHREFTEKPEGYVEKEQESRPRPKTGRFDRKK
jgi:polyribonucleotide nucleotidyltransferase